VTRVQTNGLGLHAPQRERNVAHAVGEREGARIVGRQFKYGDVGVASSRVFARGWRLRRVAHGEHAHVLQNDVAVNLLTTASFAVLPRRDDHIDVVVRLNVATRGIFARDLNVLTVPVSYYTRQDANVDVGWWYQWKTAVGLLTWDLSRYDPSKPPAQQTVVRSYGTFVHPEGEVGAHSAEGRRRMQEAAGEIERVTWS